MVFCAAQINREPEKRTNKRPQLADFRESGGIENDADVALLLYREDYYTTAEEWAATHPGQAYPQGVAEIQVAKNRQGASGERIRVYFREKSMTFENLSREAGQ